MLPHLHLHINLFTLLALCEERINQPEHIIIIIIVVIII